MTSSPTFSQCGTLFWPQTSCHSLDSLVLCKVRNGRLPIIFFFFYFSGTHLALMWSQYKDQFFVLRSKCSKNCCNGLAPGQVQWRRSVWCIHQLWRCLVHWDHWDHWDRFGDVQSHVPPATPSLRIARSLSQSSWKQRHRTQQPCKKLYMILSYFVAFRE
jgi:hypothetical protein